MLAKSIKFVKHNLLRMHRTGADENEFAYVIDLTKLCNSSTKVRFVQRYLWHIAQHKGIGQRRHTAAFLEFECSLQRRQIVAVNIVDDHATLLSFHHLKTHGKWCQKAHSFGNLCRRDGQINHQAETLHRILERCVVGHWDGEAAFDSQYKVIHLGGGFGALDIQYGNLRILMPACPRHASSTDSCYLKGIANAWNIGIVDDDITVAEKVKFFDEFLLLRLKTSIVGCSDIGKDTDSRFDDGFEFFHLARLADSSFEYSQVAILVELPDT